MDSEHSSGARTFEARKIPLPKYEIIGTIRAVQPFDRFPSQRRK